MPSLFPGMDPYLEAPTFWPAFHNRLIVAIADAIAPLLRPQYYVEIETRTYRGQAEGGLSIGIPDAVVFSGQTKEREPETKDNSSTQTTVALAAEPCPKRVQLPMTEDVKERYLEIREVATRAVVTAIEILSPKNKTSGPGRQAYEEKRQTILSSRTHLVEIDLLRGGRPMAIVGEKINTAYRLLISRSEQRPFADLYTISLQDKLPTFALPLQAGDSEPLVSLQEVFNGVYERASYDLRLDYSQPPPPPLLSAPDLKWLSACLNPE